MKYYVDDKGELFNFQDDQVDTLGGVRHKGLRLSSYSLGDTAKEAVQLRVTRLSDLVEEKRRIAKNAEADACRIELIVEAITNMQKDLLSSTEGK